jgi:hypothetical protein
MRKGIEGLQKKLEEFEAEREGVAIPTHVRWLANPCTIMERRQTREIAASLVVFVMKGNKVPQRFIKQGFKAAEVWY